MYIDQSIHYNKPKVAGNEKNPSIWVSYSKYIANFEAFLWGFLSSINPEIARGIQCLPGPFFYHVNFDPP